MSLRHLLVCMLLGLVCLAIHTDAATKKKKKTSKKKKDNKAAATVVDGVCETLDDHGLTELMNAAKTNKLEILDMLLEDEETKCVDQANKYGKTALMYAAEKGNGDVMRRLLKAGADVDAFDEYGMTALTRAAEFGRADAVLALIEEQHVHVDTTHLEDMTALMWASEFGHAGVVQVLLDHGASTGKQKQYGMTALHLAANFGKTECVRVLLEHRPAPKVDEVDDEGRTALLFASHHGHVEILRLLLHHGADILHKDQQGRDAVHMATYEHSYATAEAVELLRRAKKEAKIRIEAA